MKAIKSLLLVVCLLSTYFVESKSQSYPTYGYPVTHDLVIPWNANSVTDQFPMTYGNYSSNLRYPPALVTFITPEGTVTQSWPPNQYGLPDYLSVTVSQAGGHAIHSEMTGWYNDGTYFDSPVACYFNVTKQAPPVTHGNKCSAADLANPGQKQYTQTSDYISPGSIVNYTLSISGIDYGTTFISASAGIIGVTGISRESNQYFGTIERSASGAYTMANGGTLTLYTYVFVGAQGGQAYANACISW